MPVSFININSDEFVQFSNKLERIGRSDLPVAVRATLNQLAFEMKGSGSSRGQIEQRAVKDFDYSRNKTLFRVMTGVTKASGLDIENMQSEAGIVNKSGLSRVAEGLEQQQEGGTIKQKATPLTSARQGKSMASKVRKPARLQGLNPIDLTDRKKGRFIASADYAFLNNRPVKILGRGGTEILARIKSINRETKGTARIKMEWLYRINDGGNVSLKRKRPFVNRAAQEVMRGMPNEFIRQANKRITKEFEKK